MAGSLPVNVKFLIEGEEETGSPHLPGFIAEHRDLLAADLAYTSDGPVHDDAHPQVVYGVRGLLYVELRLTPQPLQTFTQPLRLAQPSGAGLPRTYIFCTLHPGPHGPFAERVKHDPDWRYYDIASDHDAMVTAPVELAKILNEAAQAEVAQWASIARGACYAQDQPSFTPLCTPVEP